MEMDTVDPLLPKRLPIDVQNYTALKKVKSF